MPVITGTIKKTKKKKNYKNDKNKEKNIQKYTIIPMLSVHRRSSGILDTTTARLFGWI